MIITVKNGKNIMMKNMKQINFDFGSGEGVFFTSDTHFFHDRIIDFCKRPFNNVDEMNEELIRRWNSVVGKNDIVFHLGDFAWGGPPKWNSILERLNGHIYLILGNHDMKNLKENSKQYFTHITHQMQIQIDGWVLYMNHVPFLCYSGVWSHKRKIAQAFGHVHYNTRAKGADTERLKYLFSRQYDVGVDNNDFTPISWKQLKEKFIEFESKEVNMVGEKVILDNGGCV